MPGTASQDRFRDPFAPARPLRPALRRALAGSTILAGLALFATPAAAQISASPTGCCSLEPLGAASFGGTVSDPSATVELINPLGFPSPLALNLAVPGTGGTYVNPAVPYAIGVYGFGTQDTIDTTVQGAWATGPAISLTNDAGFIPAAITGSPSYVLLAQSLGAPGFFQTARGTPSNSPVYDGAAGGSVSVTNGGSLTIGANAPSGWSGAPWLPFSSAIYAASSGGNGVGGKTNDNDIGGNGGNGGPITVTTNAGSQIILQGSGGPGAPVNGITAWSLGGGSGCDCSGDHANVYGASGTGGAVTVSHAGSISGTAGYSIGISAISVGGDGGLQTGHGIGSTPGTSGPGGAVTVNLDGGSLVSLTGGNGIGVLAASSVGPSAYSNTSNSGGPVTVTISPGASISSTGPGAFNIGVAAVSTGSPDILQPFSTGTIAANGSGYSGSVTVSNGGTIATAGPLAIGIAALSLGGSGVFTGASGTGTSALGNAGSRSNGGGTVSVTNAGAITTNGGSAFGILAASNGAGGLVNLAPNLSNGALTSLDFIGAQSASNNGNGGSVGVTNSGTIVTGDGNGGGKLAIGILAQSIGGGGGSSGGSGVAIFVGDQGGNGGNGGTVQVSTNGGQITTRNDGAIGILAQSVGGGGGNGGNAAGIFVATGGGGGNGGNGNQVTVRLATASGTDGGVTTSGDFAAGVVEQSIGGGGGNGGYAKSIGIFISSAIGGQGGDGGAGYTTTTTGPYDDPTTAQSTASFFSTAPVRTSGEQSHGVLVQSIGGGGGNGGAANAYSAGASFSAAIAVGGSGGGGGAGGTVNAANQGSIVTFGADSMGLVAQSVGGGGGNGGAAAAKSWAIASLPEIPTISFSTAIGGAGGAGGNGGPVTVINQAPQPGQSGGAITTAGNAAHGILAQSIGGGGGNGGDSTATALAFEGKAPTFKIGVAIGGSGSVAGNGQTVMVSNGATTGANFGAPACAGCTGSIITGGNNAAGIVAQSIGGGGGNGGAGNASTSSQNLGLDTGDAIGATYAMGGQGGASGNGGGVTVGNTAGSTIRTAGSGSQGILAQSIGGGGGNGGGGSAGGSGDNLDINVSVGASGSAGGAGGIIAVTNAGTISTAGGDATGIAAQSIGGGGGMAGTSDAKASIGTASQTEDAFNPPADSYSANIAVGGSGGNGGNGNTVQVTNAGAVITLGVRAYGVLAQSIGDGGGSGGAASSAANSVLLGPTSNEAGEAKSGTYAATVSVAGSGGGAGSGGAVTVSNTGSIVTAGYGAHGILAQSVGGGGGVGAEGTGNNTTTIGLGADWNGKGGAGGSGGAVTISNTSTLLATLGDDAYAILAQSIGGGGGLGGAGCSNSGSAGIQGIAYTTRCFGNTNASVSGSVAPWNDASSLSLSIGGGSGATGYSGPVSVTENGTISTAGARGFGIVAQSIGGGGGLAAASAINLAGTNLQNHPGQNTGNSYPVTVSLGSALGSTASITTSGQGAWGILAQSIGGGGGFAGDPSLPLQFPVSNTLPALNASSTRNSQYPDAGTVTVNAYGNITTTGADAHGIFAQSIGGGGGIAAGCCNSPNAVLVAGNTAQIYGIGGETYSGIGRAVTVTQYGGSTIRTSGPGSIGIIAQSSGNSAYTSPISVTVGGTVTGGTNAGVTPESGAGAAGILISGGASSQSGQTNALTVQAGGTVSTMDGAAGTAITTDYGLTNVTNAGTITGSINLGRTPGTVANSGTLSTGPTLVAATLSNAGTLSVLGDGAIGTTALTGAFTQTGAGRLRVDINAGAAQAADLLQVSGTAQIAGSVIPLPSALLPGAVTVLEAAGGVSSSATAPASLLFSWALGITGAAVGGGAQGTGVTLTPSADFTPAGVALTSSELSLANQLAAAWNNADPSFARRFASLSWLSTGAQYANALDGWSPKATQAQATVLANALPSILGAAMSCPVFAGPGTLLGEDSCAWIKASGGRTDQYGAYDTQSYRIANTTYRLGGQREIVPGWYLGGSAAVGQSWADAGGGSSGHGQVFDGSVAVKHVAGPWLLAGSVAFAGGAFHNDRLVSVPGTAGAPGSAVLLQSDSNVFIAGGRLRGAYEFSFPGWYVRPFGDFDLSYARFPGFRESGPSGYGLDVRGSGKTSIAISPMVEFGGRYDLNPLTTLRPYLAVGVSFLPDHTRTIDASFIGALPEDGTFQTAIRSPAAIGRLDVGVQLYRAGKFDVKAEYSLGTASDFLSQTGTLRAAYHF